MMGNLNKDKIGKVYIRVKVDGVQFRIPTKVKVKKAQFNGREVVKHPLKDDLNEILRLEKSKAEEKIIKSAAKGLPSVTIRNTINLYPTMSGWAIQCD